MTEGARKGSNFIVVCISPDVCRTPRGPTTVNVPYQIVGLLSEACMPSHNVRFGGEQALLVDQSMVMKVIGNEAGTGGGVISGHNRWIVEFDEGSSNVRINGKRVVRHGDLCWMNGRNTRGMVICTDGMEPRGSIKDGKPVCKVPEDTIERPARRRDEVAGKRGGFTVTGKIVKRSREPQVYSLRWQTLSAVDKTSTSAVDVVVVAAATGAVSHTLSTGDDGRTERLRNETEPDEYVAFVGSGEWTVDITSDDDPEMLEYTDWFDWEAEE